MNGVMTEAYEAIILHTELKLEKIATISSFLRATRSFSYERMWLSNFTLRKACEANNWQTFFFSHTRRTFNRIALALLLCVEKYFFLSKFLATETRLLVIAKQTHKVTAVIFVNTTTSHADASLFSSLSFDEAINLSQLHRESWNSTSHWPHHNRTMILINLPLLAHFVLQILLRLVCFYYIHK